MHNIKRAANRDLRQMKTAAWNMYIFGKRSVLMFDLKESREGFRRRETEDRKMSGTHSRKYVRGIWMLRVSEAERKYGRVCKVEDSRGDNAE